MPSAEFALGYYYEIGIGGRQDVVLSKKWYSKAASHGNTDAADRLKALSASDENALSRTQHEVQTNEKIVRRRTQAKFDSETRKKAKEAAPPPPMPSMPPVPAQQYSQPAKNRPPRTSSATPVPQSSYYPAQQSQQQQSMAMPMPLARPVVPTSESNTSLRRRETMKEVQAAAENARLSAGTPQTRNGRGRDNSASSLAPPQAGGVQRFSLVDSGPVGPAPSVHSNSSGSSKSSSVSGVAMVKPSKGPQTFEEMGLATGKVKKEEECIIS